LQIPLYCHAERSEASSLLRFFAIAQTDKVHITLNEVKGLLLAISNKILRFAQNDI